MTVKERETVGAVSKMWIFRRAKLNGAEFQSSFYKRTTARNNFTVVYEDMENLIMDPLKSL